METRFPDYLTYSCQRNEHSRCSNPRNDMFAPRCNCRCHDQPDAGQFFAAVAPTRTLLSTANNHGRA